MSGAQFLLASIVGFEVGPRVGRAIHGTELLSMGWHCGTVFGHPVAAAAASKLFDAPAAQIEDALGIACTQACGLMSAQYEGMVKRMQHGFSARNGLFGALLADGGYSGIKKVFETPYGGFLSMFSKGNSKEPAYLEDEVTKDLGRSWVIEEIQVKIHACVGCLRNDRLYQGHAKIAFGGIKRLERSEKRQNWCFDRCTGTLWVESHTTVNIYRGADELELYRRCPIPGWAGLTRKLFRGQARL